MSCFADNVMRGFFEGRARLLARGGEWIDVALSLGRGGSRIFREQGKKFLSVATAFIFAASRQRPIILHIYCVGRGNPRE